MAGQMNGPDRSGGARDSLGGTDPAGYEDVLGGTDPEDDEDVLSGTDPEDDEDVLGGTDPEDDEDVLGGTNPGSWEDELRLGAALRWRAPDRKRVHGYGAGRPADQRVHVKRGKLAAKFQRQGRQSGNGVRYRVQVG